MDHGVATAGRTRATNSSVALHTLLMCPAAAPLAQGRAPHPSRTRKRWGTQRIPSFERLLTRQKPLPAYGVSRPCFERSIGSGAQSFLRWHVRFDPQCTKQVELPLKFVDVHSCYILKPLEDALCGPNVLRA